MHSKETIIFIVTLKLKLYLKMKLTYYLPKEACSIISNNNTVQFDDCDIILFKQLLKSSTGKSF